jgi:hypothetical protein
MDGVYRKGVADPWIARSAGLRARSSAFDRSLVTLHQVVSTHHGYLEDLRTESRSGYGRALAATVSVPSSEFDATLADLKTLGRVEGISEAGEDFAVKLANCGTRSPWRKTLRKPMNPSTKPNAKIKVCSQPWLRLISISRCWKITAPSPGQSRGLFPSTSKFPR